MRDGQNANAAGRGAFSVPARARSRPVSSRRSQASRSTTPSSFLRHSTARAGDGRDERASSRPPSVDASSPPSLAASSSSEGRARDRAAAGGRRRSTTEGGGESELVRRLGTTDDRTTTGNNRQDRMPPFGGAPLDPRLHDVRPRASLFEPKTTDESIARRALSLVISHGADADVIARLATVNRALSRGRHLRARARVRARERAVAPRPGGHERRRRRRGEGGEGRRHPWSRRIATPRRGRGAHSDFHQASAEAFEAARLVPARVEDAHGAVARTRGPAVAVRARRRRIERVGTTTTALVVPRSAGGSRRGRLRCGLSHTGPHTTAFAW